MINTPDYDRAAIKALEIIRENGIKETPVDPLKIIKDYPGVRVVPFVKMADEIEKEREDLIPLFYTNQDAATFSLKAHDMADVEYIVVYNMRLPIEIIHRAIARELGHIALGHDGTVRTAETRMAEAMCFAHHLLSPRPVVNLLQKSIPITMNVLTAVLGCSDECVDDIQQIPGVHVPAELNAEVRDMFAPHINEYINFHETSPRKDRSPILDLGSYMDYYEE